MGSSRWSGSRGFRGLSGAGGAFGSRRPFDTTTSRLATTRPCLSPRADFPKHRHASRFRRRTTPSRVHASDITAHAETAQVRSPAVPTTGPHHTRRSDGTLRCQSSPTSRLMSVLFGPGPHTPARATNRVVSTHRLTDDGSLPLGADLADLPSPASAPLADLPCLAASCPARRLSRARLLFPTCRPTSAPAISTSHHKPRRAVRLPDATQLNASPLDTAVRHTARRSTGQVKSRPGFAIDNPTRRSARRTVRLALAARAVSGRLAIASPREPDD